MINIHTFTGSDSLRKFGTNEATYQGVYVPCNDLYPQIHIHHIKCKVYRNGHQDGYLMEKIKDCNKSIRFVSQVWCFYPSPEGFSIISAIKAQISSPFKVFILCRVYIFKCICVCVFVCACTVNMTYVQFVCLKWIYVNFMIRFTLINFSLPRWSKCNHIRLWLPYCILPDVILYIGAE